MSMTKEIPIPDIGGATDVTVIEIAVAPGDQIAKDDALLTLEGDKATMDIPAPFAGTIKELKVAVGDKVGQGSIIMTMDTVAAAPATKTAAEPPPASNANTNTTAVIQIPDIGQSASVDVIEVSIQVGDVIAKEQTLITLEGDKATMDIPASVAGKVTKILVKVGDKVKTGSSVCEVVVSAESATAKMPAPVAAQQPAAKAAAAIPAPAKEDIETVEMTSDGVHAGPAVRRIAREFGVDLTKVTGSGRKGRIVKQDVQHFVKTALQSSGSAGGLAVSAAPAIDFSRFGDTETKPLNKIKRLTGSNLHRNWVTIPHVTQHEEADITELENFRKAQKASAEKQGIKLTPLVFIMKAVVDALKAYPAFNASLDPSGHNLILKKYFNIGVAVDTPNGLVVPVVRHVHQKSVFDLAKELGMISQKAREKGLSVAEMEGSCFTISSLGGIGGTHFTPIVNAPDVAILGVSRAKMTPVYRDGEFEPRLILPLSLSYDHRVIDGAEGARFMVHLAQSLQSLKCLLI